MKFFSKLKTHNSKLKTQRGFTILELVIGLALIGIIGTATTVAMFQITSMNTRTQANVTLRNQLGFATNWITSDAQAAQVIDRTPTPSGSDTILLTLTWGQWESGGSAYKVEYILDSTNQLKRKQTISNKDGSGAVVTSFPIIISDASFTYVVNKDGLGTFPPGVTSNDVKARYDPNMLEFDLTARIPPMPAADAVVRVMIRSLVQ